MTLAPEHKKAHKVWRWCSSYGREEKSRTLRIEAILNSVTSLGGTIEDVSKVTDYFEPIFQQVNGK